MCLNSYYRRYGKRRMTGASRFRKRLHESIRAIDGRDASVVHKVASAALHRSWKTTALNPPNEAQPACNRTLNVFVGIRRLLDTPLRIRANVATPIEDAGERD
jgi:hypothetical protein